MGLNTEYGATLQELLDKSKPQISRKRLKILLLEIKKKEIKKLKIFQNLLEKISQSPQYIQKRQSQSIRVNVYEAKLTKKQVYLEILVPHLNNPSEEVIFESNKIKEEHKTMKLQNEEVMLKNT